jgi:hypothetical protein
MKYIIDDEDIGCLKDYFYAMINGEENRVAIKRLYEQEIGIIRSHPLSDHDAEPKCITCGGIVTSPKCDRCYANNIANIKEEIAKKERERVLDDLCNLFRWTNKEGNFRPWNIGHIEQVIAKYKESLRGEVNASL